MNQNTVVMSGRVILMLDVPDNYDRFMDHDHQQHSWLIKRPICTYCKEPIQDESYHQINGENVCHSCLGDMVVYVEE